jgi:N-acetylglutamate synthase-like GNAT family acetyltransferase
MAFSCVSVTKACQYRHVVIEVRPATEADIGDVRTLLREYEATLGFPLDFQHFDREVAELPGAYGPPRGSLLVARQGADTIGCVALRSLEPEICELKRLYVRPAARGTGLGRRLAEAALSDARRLGYQRIRLDTLPGMEAAQSLYEQMGFREIEPYTTNPVAGTRFLELEL